MLDCLNRFEGSDFSAGTRFPHRLVVRGAASAMVTGSRADFLRVHRIGRRLLTSGTPTLIRVPNFGRCCGTSSAPTKSRPRKWAYVEIHVRYLWRARLPQTPCTKVTRYLASLKGCSRAWRSGIHSHRCPVPARLSLGRNRHPQITRLRQETSCLPTLETPRPSHF